MTYKQGDKVKLCRRETSNVRRVLGQGEFRDGITIAAGEQRIFIPAGRVLQVSESTDLILGDMDASPMPRISAELVNREAFNQRFSKVE